MIAGSILYGDVNLDGRVDITDAVLLNKAVAGAVSLDSTAQKNADANILSSSTKTAIENLNAQLTQQCEGAQIGVLTVDYTGSLSTEDYAVQAANTWGLGSSSKNNGVLEGLEFCKEIDSPNCKLLLDCFHMNIEEDDIEQSIEKAADHIGYFHVSEPNRKVPNTCAHINWKAIGKALKKTGYDGAVVLEPFYKFGGEQGHNMRMWRDLDKDLSMENRLRIAEQGIEYIKTQFEE